MPQKNPHMPSTREQAIGGAFDRYARDFFEPLIDEDEVKENENNEELAENEKKLLDQTREVESKRKTLR